MRRETRQREAILNILRNTKAHPTADQIYDEVRSIVPNISKGTVYRNLQVLHEDEAITELNIDGTLSRYEVKQEDHYHFKCEKCGLVFDLDEPVNKGLNLRVSKKTASRSLTIKRNFAVFVTIVNKN